MDHGEAIRLGSTKKYVLGELPQSLCDEFEEHYFECQECALDLKAAAAFVDNAREVLREDVAKAVAKVPDLSSRSVSLVLAGGRSPRFRGTLAGHCLPERGHDSSDTRTSGSHRRATLHLFVFSANGQHERGRRSESPSSPQ